jgi:tellurite methyltransferase
MPTIIDAIKPGGLIIYETFTHQQATIGRAKNPNFLLNDDELTVIFKDFKPLYQFEGFDEEQQAFIGQFIGRKSDLKPT